MWAPDLDHAQTKYEAILAAIERDVERGRLRPGDRLPPQRRLAERLGLAVGTVSRAYAEAEERNLVVGEVGRGTFVRRREAVELWSEGSGREDGWVDLSLNLPVSLPGREEGNILSGTLREIAGGDTEALLRYRPDTGLPSQRAAAARWIARTGLDPSPDDVIVTAGAQHALWVILSKLLGPGDVLLTAELTYPGIKALARTLGRKIRAVEVDEEGIVPESLDRACRTPPPPAALYIVPTFQNPLGSTLSPARRDAIAKVAERHDLWVIEDDIHAHLTGEPPLPLAARARERTLYVQGLSKVLNVGLRVGFVAAPPDTVERLRAGVRSTLWIPAPLMTEIVALWIRDGSADRIIRRKRSLLASRQERAREILGEYEVVGDPRASHLWLRLPEGWRSDELVSQAATRKVRITGAEAFSVTRAVPAGVRISLGNPADEEELAHGIEVIREILDGGPQSSTTVM